MFGVSVPQVDVPLFFAKYGLKIAKAGLVIALAVGWTLGAEHYGINKERMEQSQVVAAERAKQLEALAKETKERVPVIEKAAQDRAKLQNTVDKGLEKLNEATKIAGPKPNCDLTPDELQAFRGINQG